MTTHRLRLAFPRLFPAFPAFPALVALSLAACSRQDPSAPSPASAAAAPVALAPSNAAPTLDGAAPDAAVDDGVPITSAEKASLIDAMIPLLDAHYLYPDVGAKMIAALRDHAARGDYASLTGSRAFGRAVTRDLRAVSHDIHIQLHYSAGPEEDTPTRAEQVAEAALAAKSGFVTVERLPGNVALMRIDAFDQFPAPKGPVEAAYAAHMAEVADASALILDLRANYGGYPETVALLLSYFFDPAPVHLNDFWNRDGDETSHSWTLATLAGPRFGAKKPIFVLTSKETISGGEEAAYDLQALKRAVVVGESSAGGANFAPRHKLDAHLTFCVPQGRAINPVTHTNWEGVGVAPDVRVDSHAALHEAHVRALRALLDGRDGKGARRAELAKALATLSEEDGGAGR